ncbi:MAG: dTDP-4-dehydrorhamnose 3,5-epimerase family protein [Chloroflexota bacterium]
MSCVEDFGLPGVRLRYIRRIVDGRGFFSEVLRSDWPEVLQDQVAQCNVSVTYPGVVRAWHRHVRGQTDCLFVVKGTLQMCAYDPSGGGLAEVFAGEWQPLLVRIPGHYFHGIRALGNEPATLVYFVTNLYDYDDPDEERLAWNDPSIVPQTINGKSVDPRVGKPWEWFYTPHR